MLSRSVLKLLISSVTTRWLEYLFIIWQFRYTNEWKFTQWHKHSQSRLDILPATKYTQNYANNFYLQLHQYGEVLSNLITLDFDFEFCWVENATGLLNWNRRYFIWKNDRRVNRGRWDNLLGFDLQLVSVFFFQSLGTETECTCNNQCTTRMDYFFVIVNKFYL